MESSEGANQLLKSKFKLHDSSEVQAAAQKTQRLTREEISSQPLNRIQNYLDRLDGIINPDPLDGHPDFDRKERNLNMLKTRLYRNVIIQPDKIPASYWESQKRIAREQGHGDIEITPQMRAQSTEVIITDQRSSLDTWVNYMTGPDFPCPNPIKYYIFRSVLELGRFDKEKKAFQPRLPDTVAPFPDLNREALAYVVDSLIKKYGPEYFTLSENIDQTQDELNTINEYQEKKTILDTADPNAKINTVTLNGRIINIRQKDLQRMRETLQQPANSDAEQLQEKLSALGNQRTQLLKDKGLPDELLGQAEDEDFGKLYVYAMEKVTPASAEDLTTVEGQWVKYNQKSDHMPLVTSLQGHGTGWCTAGESTAELQLQSGDFYVFYSNDKDGKPTVPRAAIRMEGNKIAEVRGIAEHQNLDGGAVQIVEEKLQEFGTEGASYKKKIHDMAQLTAIEHKAKEKQILTREELAFIYEVDSSIEGFGYKKDPRIQELLSQRNPEEDMPIVFGCDATQIARNTRDISSNIRAYVGPLEPGTFGKLAKYKIDQIWTSFPEGKIKKETVEIGGKTAKQLEEEMNATGIKMNSNAADMMRSPELTTLPTPQPLETVRLKVEGLGFVGKTSIAQIYAKAQELGLELCPAEVGPHLRLKNTDQSMGDWYFVGMKQITNPIGSPYIFSLGRTGEGLWLSDNWANPAVEWYPSNEFMFSLRKSAFPESRSETQVPEPLGFFRRIFKR